MDPYVWISQSYCCQQYCQNITWLNCKQTDRNQSIEYIWIVFGAFLLMAWCQMMSLPQFGKCLILSSGRTISGNLGGTETKQLNILPTLMRIFWPHFSIPEYSVVTTGLPKNIQGLDSFQRWPRRQVQVFIYREANRAVAISIYMDRAHSPTCGGGARI